MNATSTLIICLGIIASGVISGTIMGSLQSKGLISNSMAAMLWLIFSIALFSIPVLISVFTS